MYTADVGTGLSGRGGGGVERRGRDNRKRVEWVDMLVKQHPLPPSLTEIN